MPTISPPTLPISDLLLGGDWACADGDLGTLAHDAELLAICVAEPLRQELLDVARSCHAGGEHAVESWFAARQHVRDRLGADALDAQPAT